MAEQLVSIVIPCYRGEKYLAQAIESCLAQTYPELEVIVVDDASPDRCAEIAQNYSQKDTRVRLIRRKRNGGVSRAFNTGFRAAKGAYYSRLAQDDLLLPTAMERMVAYLSDHPNVGLVYGEMLKVDHEGRPLERFPIFDPDKALSEGNHVGLWVMWRREVWQKAGQFDPLFDTIEDYEFFCRVAKVSKIARLQGEPGLLFRQHPQMGGVVYKSRQAVTDGLIRRLYASDFSPSAQARVYWEVSWEFEAIGLSKLAAKCAWRAVTLQPICWTYWRRLAGSLVRHSLHRYKNQHSPLPAANQEKRPAQ